MSNNREILGLTIRTMRESRNMSQQDLADAIGKQPSAISNYERGYRAPDLDTLEALADVFNVPMSAFMVGGKASVIPPEALPVYNFAEIPVIGTLRCGPGGLALQEIEGTMPFANIKNPEEYFCFHITGDSMEPRISEGDYALIHIQPSVESGELAAVVIDDEEGMLKKIRIEPNKITLLSFNQNYDPLVFVREDMARVRIVGKVVRTEKVW